MGQGSAVVLGAIDLDQVIDITIDESRKLSVHRWPGADGDLIQDLGMASAAVHLVGVAIGSKASSRLEQLRQLMHKGEPVDFTASIAISADINQVLIEALKVHQPPGYIDYYEYELKLVRYVKPKSALSSEAGFSKESLASIKTGLIDSAGSKMKKFAADLGKVEGAAQHMDDMINEAKSKYELVKGAVKDLKQLDGLRKLITAGKALGKAASENGESLMKSPTNQ